MLKKMSVAPDFCGIINNTPSCKWLGHHDHNNLKVFWCPKLKEVRSSPGHFFTQSFLAHFLSFPWLLNKLKTPSIFSMKMIMYRSHLFNLGIFDLFVQCVVPSHCVLAVE